MRDETSCVTKWVQASTLSDNVSAIPHVTRWWRRPVAVTSRFSKAACMLTAAFALTAVLGVAPSKATAAEQDHAGVVREEAQQASVRADSDKRNKAQVVATVPYPVEPHMQPTPDLPASLSLAAAYVSEEQVKPEGGPSDDEDAASKDATRKLEGEVLTSTSEGAVVHVGAGESFSVRGSTIISLDHAGSSALSVSGGGAADVASVSTLSARGEGAGALACAGPGTSVQLSDSSAYASGERCAAIAAVDGATVSMEGGNLEATSGSAVRVEGSGSSVSLAGVHILSSGSLAELCDNVTLSLDGVTSDSSHAAAVYVAAGVPTLRLTNGSVVLGTVDIADGAGIDIQTDATSRVDGRMVYLSATNVA